MMHTGEHIVGQTTHTRCGAIRHRFRHDVDFVLIDPESREIHPFLFSRNRFNLASVHDCDHGGPLNAGRGPAWAREVLLSQGLSDAHVELKLLTQPRFFGSVFNPVTFWLAIKDDRLVAVIAEVSTPFGDRHSYLCHLPGFAAITGETKITTPKSLHVSPFQQVAGTYEFSFDISDESISIRIMHRNGNDGVVATLVGERRAMTSSGLLMSSLRRPLGGLRTLTLIYFQALWLKLKGARYRNRPAPPETEVT